MTAKDVTTWVCIAGAFVSVGAAWSNAASKADAARDAVAQYEKTSDEAHAELKAGIAEVRSEGRGTRDMAIETRSQVAQILSGLARLEQAIEKRTLVIRAAKGGE